jgi:RND family efflux transporter MFP subunit
MRVLLLTCLGALAFALALAFVAGCHEHGPSTHAHDDPGHGDHGQAESELPTESVTIWTDRTELFMEYTAFVVGEESASAAHVTDLGDFGALTEGAFTLTVTGEGGEVWTSRVAAPARAGIFRPAIRPTRSGPCALRVTVESAKLRDTFSAGPCRVFPDASAALAAAQAAPEPPTGQIAYLKEQQWQTEFATTPAAVRPLQASVGATGDVQPAAGREARVLATATGRAVVGDGATTLHPGVSVAEGQLLATILPRIEAGRDPSSLAADERVARAELQAARAELARVERLLADGAVAERRVVEARARVEIARAHHGGATGRRAHFKAGAEGGGAALQRFEVRAPIAGTLVTIDIASGESVEEGQPLFAVVDLSRVWLVARVFEADLPKVEGAPTAWFTLDGHEEPFAVDQRDGRLVTIGHVVDPTTRTVAVVFEVGNADGRLRIGQFARVHVATGPSADVLTIPAAAVLDDAGRPVAFVMVEGETFERRTLRLGRRAKGFVEVLGGVAAGERVVTRGAYEVKLAGASGAIPSHGHVH